MKLIALLASGFLGSGSACAGDIVVIVNSAAAIPTSEQVAAVYLGKSRAYTPIDQVESAAIRAEFYRKAAARDLSQVKMAWARLVFTGKGMPPKEVTGAAAVKKAVAADPKAIGYIDSSEVDGTVKLALTLE